MKNGRVIPVKVRIRDLCAGAHFTTPSAAVTIKVATYLGTPGVDDPVTEYAHVGTPATERTCSGLAETTGSTTSTARPSASSSARSTAWTCS